MASSKTCFAPVIIVALVVALVTILMHQNAYLYQPQRKCCSAPKKSILLKQRIHDSPFPSVSPLFSGLFRERLAHVCSCGMRL